MEIFGKTAVFRADMAGLGKYHMGGYGRIGVYRVESEIARTSLLPNNAKLKKV